MPSSSAVVATIASTLLLCAALLVLPNDPSAPEGAPALTTTTKLSAADSSGHCNFGHACWPDKSTWDHFSQSLGAGVLRTVDVADIDTVHAECQAGIAAHGGAGLAQFVANAGLAFWVAYVCARTAQWAIGRTSQSTVWLLQRFDMFKLLSTSPAPIASGSRSRALDQEYRGWLR